MPHTAVYPVSRCAVWVHAVCFSPLSLGEERVQRWLTVLPLLCGRGNGRNQQQEQATPAQRLQTYREHLGQVPSGELTRAHEFAPLWPFEFLFFPPKLHLTATSWHDKVGAQRDTVSLVSGKLIKTAAVKNCRMVETFLMFEIREKWK